MIMKNLSRLVLHFLILTTLALSLFVSPRPAFAAPGIASVQPNPVSNATPTTLIITGSGFVTGTVAVLNGYGALATAYVSNQVLTADLPTGVPQGTYSLTVINPDSTSATLANALTIVGPTATPAPTAFARPLIVVQSYGASSTEVVSFQDYDFEMTLVNSGQATASNVVATFKQGDFTARATGGVRSLGALTPGQNVRFFQPLTSGSLSGNLATLEVLVTYTDLNGTIYSDTFTLTFQVYKPPPGPAVTATPTPTSTPRVVPRPQLVISGYRTDVIPLQPGTRFTLQLDLLNVGSASARRVTMIVGGGSASGGPSGGAGTPSPGGGISGGGADFTNFAPVDASNVQFLGDLNAAASLAAKQTLVVNATTKPGAYPMKFSFVYSDEQGVSYADDQAITLLVYQLPLVEIGFYQETGPLFAGQPNVLPLQVVNLGRNSVALGNLEVTAPVGGAQFSNNVSLVGVLDTGGFPFTLDATVIPDVPGSLELLVTVDYTDDFNQPQQITKTLTVEVMEGFIEPLPTDGGVPEPPPPVPETLLDKLLRFLKGLLGLGSSLPNPGGQFPPPGEVPPVEGPLPRG